jgi:DNA-binding CsgD family transcriptional regulator
VNDPLNGNASLAEVANFHPDYVRSYETHYGRDSPWVREFLRLPAGSLLYRSLVPQLELESTEYYNDWLKPQGLKDALGGILDKTGSRLSYVAVVRSECLGDFSELDHRPFQIFLENLMRALRVHARLTRISALELALFDALDRAGLAAFAVSEDRRVVGHNGIADAWSKNGTSLQVRNGLLASNHPAADDQLERAIRLACRLRHGRTIILPPNEPDSPALVGMVMPMTASGSRGIHLTDSNRCALVLVKDPARSPKANADVLRPIFGLTAAEARLLADLTLGKSLEEISEQRGVRYGTLRAQLRAVMSKTDTKRQGELIALASRYTALNLSP